MPDPTTAPAEGARDRVAAAIEARVKASVLPERPPYDGSIGLAHFVGASFHDLADVALAALAGDPGDLPAQAEIGALRNRIAALEANGAELLARAERAEAEEERMRATPVDWDAQRRRADELEAEVERLRAELAEASDALCAVGKAALVVAPTLAKPYPDAPKTSPWQQFMERPVRDAYNLGKRIRRELKEARDAR